MLLETCLKFNAFKFFPKVHKVGITSDNKIVQQKDTKLVFPTLSMIEIKLDCTATGTISSYYS